MTWVFFPMAALFVSHESRLTLSSRLALGKNPLRNSATNLARRTLDEPHGGFFWVGELFEGGALEGLGEDSGEVLPNEVQGGG